MVDRGELVNDHGRYELTGALLSRQRRQEASLEPRRRDWDGFWDMRIVPTGSRASAERATLRRALTHLRLEEWREGVWMRPDNLDRDRLPDDRAIAEAQTQRFASVPHIDSVDLAYELFAVEDWSNSARDLLEEMDRTIDALNAGDHDAVASSFALSAAVVRHLVADPLLPDELLDDDWPADRLRASYRDYNKAYRSLLAQRTGSTNGVKSHF